MNGYFAALHQRLTHLYAAPCSCPQCQSKPTQTATLNNKNQKRFKKILKAAEIAFKKLHQRQGYKPEDLAEVPEYLQLIQDTASLLSAPIADNVMPATMAQALKSDAFLFGGMKVHAQLFQAGTMLLHPDGSRKTYNQLRQELDTLNTTYNQHHLQAEYLFATTAAQSAARWAALETDTERYLLQYRTAGDSRVRDSHTALNRVTLPATHTFWSSYYPPNGWRCRCLAIEVRAKDHPATDSATAIADGEKATTQIGKNGKNSLEIFRFNPGKDKRLFPPAHPLYPKNCNGEKLNLSGLIGAAQWLLDAEEEKCKAKKVVEKLKNATHKQLIKQRQKEYESYKSDELYKDVRFNTNNGGLMATHVLHNFDKATGKYEIAARNSLFKSGDKVILEKENLKKGEIEHKGTKKIDGYYNNKSFDLGTVLSLGKYTVKNKLQHAMDKNAEVAIIYFPEKSLYSKRVIADGLSLFRKFRNYSFHEIVIIAGDDVIK